MGLEISRPGVVAPVSVDPDGVRGPTPGQARGPGWRRTALGMFVPTATDSTKLEQRIVEAVAGCGSGAAATGWAGLAWARARWFGGLAPDGSTMLPVPVALGDRRTVRPRPGTTISEDWLFGCDVLEIDGLPITIAERSVAFEARRAESLLAAVRVIDMAAADDLVDLDSMAAYTARLSGRPGVRRLRRALELAEENAWSPPEVTMRIHWRREIPTARLLCNPPVFDRTGRHLLTPDLLDPAAGVAGEYDGLVHLEDGPRRRDLDRDALYRDLGIEPVTMMSAAQDDRDAFRARLQRAYRRTAARRDHDRPWTLDQPEWWVDTSTVSRRRSLTEPDRARWLRYRSP